MHIDGHVYRNLDFTRIQSASLPPDAGKDWKFAEVHGVECAAVRHGSSRYLL